MQRYFYPVYQIELDNAISVTILEAYIAEGRVAATHPDLLQEL